MTSLRETVGQLSRAQKPSAGTPAYSRFVNRRIGRVFAAAAFLGHRTPNQVSLASGFCSLVGIVLVATVRPSLPLALAVTALLVLGYGLDSADGQLARLRGGGSPLGEWLDHMIDAIKIVLLHSAVLISFYRFDAFSNELVLLIPLAYVCMSSVLFFGLILIDQLRRRHGGAQKPNERGDSVAQVVAHRTDRLRRPLPGLPDLRLAVAVHRPVRRPARGQPAVPRGRDRQVVPRDGRAAAWSERLMGIVGYAPGVYDMFHIGHLNILRRAREHCDHLIAGVVEDDVVARIKGRPPVVPHDERMDVVRALGLVDEVVSDWSSDKFEMWKQLRYDVLFKGDDWKGTEKGMRLERLLGEVGAQVHYFPYTASTSSTDLRRLLEGMS